MFGTLIVSKRRTSGAWRRQVAGPSFSLLVHTVFVYAAAMATASSGPDHAGPVADTTVIQFRTDARTPPGLRTPTLPKMFRMVAAPITVPTSIPPIDLDQTFDPASYRGVGRELGPERPEAGRTELTRIFVEALVD